MPIKITVKADFARVERALSDLAVKQLPYATAAALTDTARAARDEITAKLPQIFDRPVPFTLNAVGMKSATKQTLAAEVFIKDQQAKYLLPEEVGGPRIAANNTRKPGAAFSVPGAIPLDAHGNIPNGAIKALGELAKSTDPKDKRRLRALASKIGRKGQSLSIAYFKGTGPHGQGPGGFFERLPGDHLKRLTSFETQSTYRPIFGFRARVTLIAAQTFRTNLSRRLREALSTAK